MIKKEFFVTRSLCVHSTISMQPAICDVVVFAHVYESCRGGLIRADSLSFFHSWS